MNETKLIQTLNKYYQLDFDHIEKFRTGGTSTFTLFHQGNKYFLKMVGKAFKDTFLKSLDVMLYLKKNEFNVPDIILNKLDNLPYLEYHNNYIVVYSFLETKEIDVSTEAKNIGLIIGRLHKLMNNYDGELIIRDKAFYIDRYLEILKLKEYPRLNEYIEYSDELWEQINYLDMGYCHGDMYCGNIEKDSRGNLYIFDFDTSCIGFSLYDLALICNQTDYFKYQQDGLDKTITVYNLLLPSYLKEHSLKNYQLKDILHLIALYHFTLQATIIEIYGLDCVDHAFFDKQLAWLYQWKNQVYEYLNK